MSSSGPAKQLVSRDGYCLAFNTGAKAILLKDNGGTKRPLTALEKVFFNAMAIFSSKLTIQ